MITNKLNTYIGWIAFVCFWITITVNIIWDINESVIIPTLLLFFIIQVIAMWMPDAIYVPNKFLGLTSERSFLDQLKVNDEFQDYYGIPYKITEVSVDQIGITSPNESIILSSQLFVKYLINNRIVSYNNKPIKFDPLWQKELHQ